MKCIAKNCNNDVEPKRFIDVNERHLSYLPLCKCCIERLNIDFNKRVHTIKCPDCNKEIDFVDW